MNLLSTTQLTKQFGMGSKRVLDLLEAGGVKTASEVPFGRGTLKLFELVAATRVLTEQRDADKLKAEAKAAKPEPAPAVPMQAAQEVMNTLLDGHEALRELFEKSTLQNAALLRAVEDLKAGYHAKIDALQETVDTLQTALDNVGSGVSILVQARATPALGQVEQRTVMAAPPVQPAPQRRPHIAIFGLTPTQVTSIKQEFGQAFEIEFIEPGWTKRLGARDAGLHLAKCEAVVAMMALTTKPDSEAITASGHGAKRLTGSISSLRNTLTDLYVTLLDKKPA